MRQTVFSKTSLLVFSIVSSALLLLVFFPLTFHSGRQIIVCIAATFVGVLLIQKILTNSSPLDKLANLLTLTLSLAFATATIACTRAIFAASIEFFSIYAISGSLSLIAALFMILKDPVRTVLHHCIPWIQPPQINSKNSLRLLIPDLACLEDGRICDLVKTGLLDQQLFIPHFIVEKIKEMMDADEDFTKERAKQAYDTLCRLENSGVLPTHNLYAHENVELSLQDQVFDLAKALKATILSNDSSIKGSIKPEHAEVPIIFLEAVASALKPTMPKGQQLSIKIQRLGKEPKQGIGYLDDRTMVVVNGGGDYLGRQVKIQVLSQKYSASGKIIFCNLIDGVALPEGYRHMMPVCAEEYAEHE